MGISPRITCIRVWIRLHMVHNTPSSSFSSMWISTKIPRCTETIIPSIDSIRMVSQVAEALLMPRARLGDVSAELVISAINSGPSVTGKAHVLIVLVSSCSRESLGNEWFLTVHRIRLGLRIYPGTQEARKSISQRPRTASCRRRCKWTKVSYRSII